jgi:hypothetical protein
MRFGSAAARRATMPIWVAPIGVSEATDGCAQVSTDRTELVAPYAPPTVWASPWLGG